MNNLAIASAAALEARGEGQGSGLSVDLYRNLRMTWGTLAPSEDEENNVTRIERQGEYETVAASQSDQVLGGVGAVGDYLEKLVITVGTAATAAVSIKDGGGSAIPIMPNSPGGGIGVYVVLLDLMSTVGAWSVTTGAGSTVVAVGRFS